MNERSEKLTRDMNELMGEMKEALLQIYGDNLRGLYLYGSRMRREGTPESDVDMIIVLKNFERYWEEVQRTSHIVSNLSLKYNVGISPVRFREVDWLDSDSPFLNAVRGQSISA